MHQILLLNLLRFSTNNSKTNQVRDLVSNFCIHCFKDFYKVNMLVYRTKKQLNHCTNSDYSNAPVQSC